MTQAVSRQFVPATFIDDGFTQGFSIAQRPGVCGGISGLYRPLINRRMQQLFAMNNPANHKPPAVLPAGLSAAEWVELQIDEANCRAVASQLVEWDVVDAAGNAVEITPGNVSRLAPSLLRDLVQVICGTYQTPISLDSVALQAILAANADDAAKITALRNLLEQVSPKPAETSPKN